MIYFIQAVDEAGPIKIGLADFPRTRLANIQMMSPVRLKLLAVIEGGRDEERELHRRFVDYQSHGEWFHPSSDLIEFIKNFPRTEVLPREITPRKKTLIKSPEQSREVKIRCRAIVESSNLPCSRLARVDGYCYHHLNQITCKVRNSSDAFLKIRCSGITISGSQCRRLVLTHKDDNEALCYFHWNRGN